MLVMRPVAVSFLPFALLIGFLVSGVPRPAEACSCMAPPAWVLPVWGSHEIPPETRIFVYKASSGEAWFSQTGEAPAAKPPDVFSVEAFRLVCDGTDVPLAAGDASAADTWPHWLWLVPGAKPAAGARCHVLQVASDGTNGTPITEFTVAVDDTVSQAKACFANKLTATLTFFDGSQSNLGGDCGGVNVIHVKPGRWASPSDPCANVVLDLSIGREGEAVEPLAHVPFLAYKAGIEVGWTPACSDGIRRELAECASWCVAGRALDLDGATTAKTEPVCVTLSSLQPEQGERAVCPSPPDPGPGDSGPGDSGPIDTETSSGDSEACSCAAGDGGSCAASPTGRPQVLLAFALLMVMVAVIRRTRRLVRLPPG